MSRKASANQQHQQRITMIWLRWTAAPAATPNDTRYVVVGSAANRWERDNINHMHQPLAYIGYNQMGQITSWLLNFTRSIHLRANLCWAICNGYNGAFGGSGYKDDPCLQLNAIDANFFFLWSRIWCCLLDVLRLVMVVVLWFLFFNKLLLLLCWAALSTFTLVFFSVVAFFSLSKTVIWFVTVSFVTLRFGQALFSL